MTSSNPPSRRQPALAFRDGRFASAERVVPEEVAIAITVGGSTHAVMMATPRDVEDLALGLALAERIVSTLGEVEHLDVVETDAGLDCQFRLVPERARTYVARRRQMTGPVGCGLCGVESLELAAPPLPVVRVEPRFPPALIAEAMEAMSLGQRLGRETRAVHAAGFFRPDEGLIVVREDVGRHNALDKVAGHLARTGVDPGAGFVVLTSRVSVELVQKCAVMGASLVAAVSAPTALAVDTAARAGVTLVAVVRGPEFELFTHPRRVSGAVDEGSRDHAAA